MLKKHFILRSYFKEPKIAISMVILAVLLCAAFATFLFPPRKSTPIGTYKIENLGTLPPIVPGDVYTQAFTSDDDYSQFGLLFAGNNQILDNGTMEVEVYHQGIMTGHCSKKLIGLMDLFFFYCDCSLKKDQNYELSIFTKDTSLPITFFSTTADMDKTKLDLNGKPQKAVIVMDFAKERKDYMVVWYFIVAANIVICYLIINIGQETHESKRKN